MIRKRLCREYIEEIERLERSIVELEEEITELRMQLRKKTEEVTSLSIENTSLRHRIEMQRKMYEKMVELLKKIKFPVIYLLDDDDGIQ